MGEAQGFGEAVIILADQGVFQHLNKMTWGARVVAVAAPGDQQTIAKHLTNIEVIEPSELPEVFTDGLILLDCAPRRGLFGELSLSRPDINVLSLFADGLAFERCGRLEYSLPRPRGPRFYIVTSPRSGSTFVSDMMTSADVFGAPTEHLKPWVAEALAAADVGYGEFIDALHRVSATSNGVFGSKVIIDDLFAFLPRFSEEVFGDFRDATVFYLTRGDKAAQAISAVRADELSVYHARAFGEVSQLHGLDFDPNPSRVFDKERWLLRQEADVLNEFKRHGVTPIPLSYEAIVQSRPAAEAAMVDIARRLAVVDYETFKWPALTRIGAVVRPRGLLNYRTFRASVHLYSARSEPSLSEVLGVGWLPVEHWGVRADSEDVEINIPAFAPMAAFELEVNETGAAPLMLQIGGLEIQLPERGGQRTRLVFRISPDQRAQSHIAIKVVHGALAIEEIVFHEILPIALAGESGLDAVVLPA